MPGMMDEIRDNSELLTNISTSLLSSALSSMTQIIKLMHVYVFFEDAVVLGEIAKSTLHSYRLLTTTMQKMLVQGWFIMYSIYRARVQVSSEDLKGDWRDKCSRFSSAIHAELGIRQLCKLQGRILLKVFLKDLLDFDLAGSEPDLVQCLKCQFNFDISLDIWDLADHKADFTKLDRDTAIRIFPFVLTLAEKKKSAQGGLKGAIKDAMQSLVDVIGTPSERDKDVAYNTKMLNDYIAGPINPLALLGSMRGEGVPNFVSIRSDYADVAQKGFFFEYGSSLYARYKFAKKNGNQDVDDVDDIIKYFKFDLICGNFEKWEPWYRLGGAYEFQFEDDVTFGAEKMNTKKEDLVTLEKRVLQCFQMALALAVSDEDEDTAESSALKASLFTDFALKIYSAVRPPMERESFMAEGFDRHCSGAEGVFTRPSPEVSLESALKVAVSLFRRAIQYGSTDWRNHYMLAKCYGKLEMGPKAVLPHLSEAVSQTPIRDKGEQILEPHYKLVSTVYKFVKASEMTVSTAKTC